MAVTFLWGATKKNTTGTFWPSQTLVYPQAPQSGDVIVIGVSVYGFSAGSPEVISIPGFTQLVNFDSKARIFYRVCDGAEGTSVVVSFSPNALAPTIAAAAYHGADQISPISVHAEKIDGANYIHTMPTIVVSGSNGMAVGVVLQHSSGGRQIKPPTGWLERAETVVGNATAAEIHDKAATAPGTYGGGTLNEYPFIFSPRMSVLHIKVPSGLQITDGGASISDSIRALGPRKITDTGATITASLSAFSGPTPLADVGATITGDILRRVYPVIAADAGATISDAIALGTRGRAIHDQGVFSDVLVGQVEHLHPLIEGLWTRWNADAFFGGPTATFGAETEVLGRFSVCAPYFQQWEAVIADDPASDEQIIVARLAFPEAQRELVGRPLARPKAQLARCGWHGTGVDLERGSFAVVRSGGPLAAMVGKRLKLTTVELVRARSVYVFCHSEADLVQDITVSRRAFESLQVPGIETVEVTVEEVS